MALLSMMAAMMGGVNYSHAYEQAETEEERKARLNQAQIERYKRQGLKEFTNGEVTVWALNEKSANRKFKNLNQ